MRGDPAVSTDPGAASGSVDSPASDPIRALIVDDHALFRRGLEMVLAAEDDIELVGEASDGTEAVQKAGESRVIPISVVGPYHGQQQRRR